MRCSAQGPHMNVELIGQDLKRHPLMQRPSYLRRLRLANDSLWCRPSARIPRAERLEGHSESRRALCLGQA
jgi:hypothetical protein